MKRATVIVGASAYILANAGPREIPVLVQNALGKARARLAGEERRAMDLLWQSSPKDPQEDLREAANIVARGYEREVKALESLDVFAVGDERARDYINDNLNELSGGESAAQDRLQRHARAGRKISTVRSDDKLIVEGGVALAGTVIHDTFRSHHLHHAGGVLGSSPGLLNTVAELQVCDPLDLADLWNVLVHVALQDDLSNSGVDQIGVWLIDEVRPRHH